MHMNSRDRIQTTLKKGIPDRVGMLEAPWAETVALWRKQGLPADQDPLEYFDMDIRRIGCDMSMRFKAETIEETDEYVIERDANGVTKKRLKTEHGHTPQWLDHVIKTSSDWKKHRHRRSPSKDRIPADTKDLVARHREKGRYIALTMTEPYEGCWPMVGQVGIFTAMMDEPEFVADMFSNYADLAIAMFEMYVQEGIDYDGVWFWGDLGYRNSTLFSPELYRELLFPCHKRMCDKLKELGKTTILHSCGKILTLIPMFIEAGFDAIQPLEAKCGQDVRELKKQYDNQITFFGNIDIRKLSGTREDVEEEVMGKLPIAMEGGGYIFHSDHSVPPTVSFENYCYAVELVRKHGVYG